ncbi:MAG: helix-turn-helix domain-containing protein [Desulfovibrio sp.]
MGRRSNAINAITRKAEDALRALGSNVRLARLRRRITQKDLAERMSVSPVTVAKLEKGDPSVGLSVLLMALDVMDLVDDIALVAHPDNDEIGKTLEDARPKKIWTRKKSKDLEF